MNPSGSGGPRGRRARIVATLGPASADEAQIRALFGAGADAFRLNFGHATHAEQAARVQAIRRIEADAGRPIGVLVDLPGPKLRLGAIAGGAVRLAAGAPFRLDLDAAPGDTRRAPLPHPEVFAALDVGSELLIDEGRLRLRVERRHAGGADTRVVVGGTLSDRKGVNVPGVVLPISALTAKDRADLAFALGLGVDWVALSFVQRAHDIEAARRLIGDRAWIMAKLERPAAIADLAAIVAAADGVMVARGDLGVEMQAEQVPEVQRQVVRACRRAGKPVVVATQLLESMVQSPVPSRAEVSDVATAVYDGVDALLLATETAAGGYPLQAVEAMHRIVCSVEASASYRSGLDASAPTLTTAKVEKVADPDASAVGADAGIDTAAPDAADAVCVSLRRVAALIAPAATITYTASGATSLRAARERPATPILSLTPDPRTARRLSLVWGLHPVLIDQLGDVAAMVRWAQRIAVIEGYAGAGDDVVIIAGMPFGVPGATNLLHVSRLPGPVRQAGAATPVRR